MLISALCEPAAPTRGHPEPGPALAAAIAALQAGGMIVMVDDEDRENEGDIVFAAEHVTPARINFLVTEARGLVCLSMEAEQVERLGLPMMVRRNKAPLGTAFTVSIEARQGVSTGISAHDRARTIQVASDPDAGPHDVVSPGHIFPLRAVPGGVLARRGHTEGSTDILKLAGLRPAAVICEVMSADGSMARLPELREFAARHGLPIVGIDEIARHCQALIAVKADEAAAVPAAASSLGVQPVGQARLPAVFGDASGFTVHAFRDPRDGQEHLAVVHGDLRGGARPLVRLHSECLTGDALGSMRCDCGAQLQTALMRISQSEAGVLIYLRGHEGRGIGLANKIRAYALQDQGLDTIEANHRLGFAADERDWHVASDILRHFGIGAVDLLTNNPAKIDGLQADGIEVVERVPLEIAPTVHSKAYLEAKRTRMGHQLRVAAEPSTEGHAFTPAFQAELLELFRWRRDVRHFRSDPLPKGQLEALLEAAYLAPSVGLSQPWRFVIVEDPARRAAIRANFESANAAALALQPGERAALYARLKLAGLDKAPCHVAVFSQHDPAQGGGLGRRTMPETTTYSSVMAVYTLWLAARAAGIGLGWVSILDPVAAAEALGVPREWVFVGYLCLGYPEKPSDTPELERVGWERRRSVQPDLLRR
jgi:3,4-dihydroxy 2-butanone 4-phosphate synthase/GTP cyclohydrolase II